MLTSIRQGLAVLLDGMLGLVAVMFVSTALMVAVLFSAIITERRRELGLLKAIGALRLQIVGMLLCEAALATAVGGLIGCRSGCCCCASSSIRSSTISTASACRSPGSEAAR